MSATSHQSAGGGTNAGFIQFREEEKGSGRSAGGEDISYAELIQSVRKTFDSGRTKDVNWRKQQLRQLKKLVVENHEQIAEALIKDHKGPKLRASFDMGTAATVDKLIADLDEWVAPMTVPHNSLIGKSYVRKEPKGVVLVIAPWNFPFAMVYDVLLPIIAAGNCCVIKPSEVSVHTCAVIESLLPKYVDNDAVKVVTGGIPETTALLREKFDHIFYTGNGAVGRVVMAAAAKNLTPVTLELGGKSPVYVDKSAKLATAVARVGSIKWMNAAPDYILVHEDIAEAFKTGIVAQVKKFYGNTPEERQKHKDFGRIINAGHVSRISKLLESTKGEVLIGGDNDPSDRYFSPTILDSPSLDDKILREEIFGPVLPIVVVKDVNEAAEKVNQIAKNPLALYIFAEDQKVVDHFLNHTNSGGVAVNTTLEQLTNHELPFGGVGESGIGRYHGKWGFDEFTHFRGVFVKDTTFTSGALVPPPPYKDSLYSLIMKFTVLGFFTDAQKMMLKVSGTAAAVFLGYRFARAKL